MFWQKTIIVCLWIFTLTIVGVEKVFGQSFEKDSLILLLYNTDDVLMKMDLYNKLRRATYYSDPRESEIYTARYLEYALKSGDSLQIAIARFYMGNAYIINNNPDKALSLYLQAAKYFELKDDELSRLSSTYNGIASAYENNISDSLSLVYFEKSYQTSKKANDKRRMGIALINMSNIHNKSGHIDKAIELLELSIGYLQDSVSTIYLKPAKINLAAAYTENNEYHKAEQILQNLLSEIDSTEDVLNYAKTLGNYGRLYQKKDDDYQALYYFQRAFDKFTAHGFNKERYNIMPYLIDAKYNVNQLHDALNLFYQYNFIKDSIYSLEKDKNITWALQKFEAEKKDRMLLEQQLEIEKSKRQKNLIMYGLGAMVFLVVVLILFYRNRLQYQKTISRQNENIQKQQITELTQKNKLISMNSMLQGQDAERLRIAKDLHDSLGGLLSNIKAHFTAFQNEQEGLKERKTAKRTLQLIDEACIEVRKISHNMMPHALSISGLEGALEDLAEYLRTLEYKISLDIRHLPDNIRQSKQIALFRLIQELLSNIRKHANARSILIQLFGHKDGIHLIIEDDGIGFDYDSAIASGGLGIKSVNSRVEFLDGEIQWESIKDEGTTINISIPL